MNQLIAPLWQLISAGAVVGARPSLPTDGADITPWRRSAYTPALAVVLLDGTAGAALTPPGGGSDGVELWGYVNSLWKFLGSLKGGAQVNIASATQGYAEEIQHVGIATRLAIAATVGAGVVTATFAPVELLL